MLLGGGTLLPYGYLWWTGTTTVALRDRAFAAIGLCGQYVYVNPTAKVVIVVWSAQLVTDSRPIDDWVFFDAVVRALGPW